MASQPHSLAAWKSAVLGELGEFRNGVNFTRDQEGPGLPVLKVKDFGERVIAPDRGYDELDPTAIAVPQSQMLEAGDTVIMRSNGNSALVGRSLFVAATTGRPLTFSGFCIRFRPSRGSLHPRFAAYLIRSPQFRTRFTAFGSGTGIQNLSQGVLAATPVLLPPLAEQRAIAHILGALDDKIELNRRMIETLEAIARALFKSWFVDFDPVRAKAAGRQPFGMDAETAKLFPSEFHQRAGREVPTGWSVVDLASTAAYLARGIGPSYVDEGGIRVVNQKCVRDRRVDFSKARRHDISRRSSEGRLLEPGDILVNSTGMGTLGRVAQVWRLDEPTIIDSHVSVVRSGRDLSALILGLDLTGREEEIEALGEGSTGQTELSRIRLGTLTVLIPHARVQEAFAERVQALVQHVDANVNASEVLAELRDTLLPRLLSGEIRVKDAEHAVGLAV